MSGGQRRRFDIALGLMHDPKLVFLDEPTTGLDPQSRANLWDHIRSLREEHGVTIVLTTHYLDEADVLADRLLVMDGGSIVANDTPDSLKARVSGDVSTSASTATSTVAEKVAREALDVRDLRRRRGQLTSPSTAATPPCRAAPRARRRGLRLTLGPGQPPDARRRVPHPDRPLPPRRRR